MGGGGVGRQSCCVASMKQYVTRGNKVHFFLSSSKRRPAAAGLYITNAIIAPANTMTQIL